MKKITFILFTCFLAMETFAQKETFDYATYTAPQGWKKDTNENAIQFTKEDAATGAYCAITLFKAIPAKPIAQNNFDLAWTSVVKSTPGLPWISWRWDRETFDA